MKITNVIIKNANLNILRNTTHDTLSKVEVEYKTYQAPSVVFESDDGAVLYGVARTLQEYVKMSTQTQEEMLQDAKDTKLKAVVTTYSEGHKQALEGYSLNEQATFTSQELEFLKWDEDDTVATPTVDQIALARGVDRLILLPKIGLNLQARNAATGQQQALEDSIKACTTIDQLESIVI